MEHSNQIRPDGRRGFLGKIVAGASAIGMATVITPLKTAASDTTALFADADDPDAWFSKMKGKHRIVIDCTEPHDIFPFAWPKVFIMTNKATGATDKDVNVVVVFRHSAIPYALEDSLWAKYKFGEFFKIDDVTTKAPAVRNPFWKPKPDDYKVPGLGSVAIGINDLQNEGAMFCACSVAITVYSAVMAEKMSLDPETVKKEWMAGVLPGVQLMPSGMWAIGRAQEHGCGYCFAG
jgi:hypothetical protein